MLERLKKLYNPLAPLEYVWLSTPSPNYDGAWGPETAAIARTGYRLKAKAAIQTLVESREAQKTWLRKKVEKRLQLEVAWSRMALADALRWAICCGLEVEDIQELARNVPPVPVSGAAQSTLFRELTARFLDERESPSDALLAVLHLHAVLLPSFDITTLENVALAINGHAMHKLAFSASVEVVCTVAMAATAHLVRAGLAALAAMIPSQWGAKAAVAALAFSAGRFITKGLTRMVSESIGKLYALLVVHRGLEGVEGLEPYSGLRRPGYPAPQGRRIWSRWWR